MPGVAQVVSVRVGHSDQGFDGVDVLLLHLGDTGAGRQQGESGQGLDVRVPLQLQIKTKSAQPMSTVLSGKLILKLSMCRRLADLHVEDTSDPDGTSNALQTQRGHFRVIAVLQSHTERCQQGGPCQLQHTQVTGIFPIFPYLTFYQV